MTSRTPLQWRGRGVQGEREKIINEDNLKWHNDVDFICKKASSRLYFLKVLKRSSVFATDMCVAQ